MGDTAERTPGFDGRLGVRQTASLKLFGQDGQMGIDFAGQFCLRTGTPENGDQPQQEAAKRGHVRHLRRQVFQRSTGVSSG